MNLKYLLIWLSASMLLGCGCAAALPFSGAAALDADAGDDQHVSQGTLVELDGSGSTGTGLTYNWTEGGTVLSDQASFSRKFSIGTHTITLTVSDGTNTDADTVVVRVNQPPIADAGEDRVVSPDTYVKLDASGSKDLDGSIASYEWTEDGMPISTRKSFNKIFGYGVHKITLTVTDDFGDQDTDCMVVLILLRGDLNHDGVVTPADAAIALQLAACGECAARASADPRSTSPAAGTTSVPMAQTTQASALGMSVTDAACIIRLDGRYGDAEAQEAVVTLTLTNTGGEPIVEHTPALPSSGECITLTALGCYPIIIPGNESVDVQIKVCVAGDVAEGTYHATAYFGDRTATITINVRRLTRYNLDCEIADVSGDGQVTSLDALMILQMAAKDPGAVPEIAINELMPNPIGADRGNETTELHNCGDEEVDIGGWVLENEDGECYEIPAGTTIEPHGYYLTTKIQLDNGGGYVLLYRDGEEVDRSIEYTHSSEGLSWQRRIDGLDTDSDGDWIERDPTFGVLG